MLHELNIPRMGSVENAKLVEWRIAEGAAFAEGDVLYEIETDKTATEVEATAAGVLARQLAQPGDEFKVGDKIGLWADPGVSSARLEAALADLGATVLSSAVAEPPAAAVAAAAEPSPREVRPLSIKAAGGTRISPLARRLAAQLGVDVADLTGSGVDGKITGNDIRAVASGSSSSRAVSAAEPKPPGDRRPPAPVSAGAAVISHSLRRKTIARRMVEAGAVPSLTADMEVDLTALFALRKKAGGDGSSVLGLIAHAAVAALLEHPRLNAHWSDEALTIWSGEVHLGVAVDTADGLVVPVIRNAERLSPHGLTLEIARLAQAARGGALASSDLEGGTFTISNPGSVGPVLRAEALLNVPQVALLGLPGIARVAKPVPDGEGGWALAIRQVVRACVTFDHRALDGGPVIAFLNALKQRIETL